MEAQEWLSKWCQIEQPDEAGGEGLFKMLQALHPPGSHRIQLLWPDRDSWSQRPTFSTMQESTQPFVSQVGEWLTMTWNCSLLNPSPVADLRYLIMASNGGLKGRKEEGADLSVFSSFCHQWLLKFPLKRGVKQTNKQKTSPFWLMSFVFVHCLPPWDRR